MRGCWPHLLPVGGALAAARDAHLALLRRLEDALLLARAEEAAHRLGPGLGRERVPRLGLLVLLQLQLPLAVLVLERMDLLLLGRPHRLGVARQDLELLRDHKVLRVLLLRRPLLVRLGDDLGRRQAEVLHVERLLVAVLRVGDVEVLAVLRDAVDHRRVPESVSAPDALDFHALLDVCRFEERRSPHRRNGNNFSLVVS
mmetsp:Transcript_29242/g.76773  ORF Transcript_29242/g.76773 Transcript_29242/m.76773 type:complete len:200 (+) Transcript_29242:124-723(+)